MHYSTAFLLAAISSIGTATPLKPRDLTKFPAGTKFDIVLRNDKVSLNDYKNSPVKVIDFDLEDNYDSAGQNNISALVQAGKTVICYFSAGSREDWRADADDFHWPNDYGKNMTGWEGENWLNLKSTNVKDIMSKRIQMAKAAGCNAIDPDNVDGYQNNQDGYGYDKSVYIDYIKWLSQNASAAGLSMGLKNAIDIIPDVIDSVEFAVNEQCHEFLIKDNNGKVVDTECIGYRPFKTANKAVFNIEYNVNNCTSPAGTVLSTVHKPLELDALGGQC